jgi:hypothetical protein
MESDLDASGGTGSEQQELRATLEQQGRELLQMAGDKVAAEAAAAQRESKLHRRLQQRAAT